MTSYFAPSPYDWPLFKIEAPKSLKGTDLFPAVTLTATRSKVKKFGDVVEQEDELGTCQVAHFAMSDTLIIFYQSALDDKDYWTVFVDMVNCVKKEQLPTKLGNAVVQQLTAGAIKPEWQNDEADTEYRSRRKTLSLVGGVERKPTIKRASLHSDLLKTAQSKKPREAANDLTMVIVANGKARRFVAAKKAAPAKKLAVKKTAAPAKQVAVAKKAAIAKRAAAPTKRAVTTKNAGPAKKAATAKKATPSKS